MTYLKPFKKEGLILSRVSEMMIVTPGNFFMWYNKSNWWLILSQSNHNKQTIIIINNNINKDTEIFWSFHHYQVF